MNEILKDNGGNNYNIPHMNKDALMRENRLPLKIKVTEEAKNLTKHPTPQKSPKTTTLQDKKAFTDTLYT